MNKVVFIFGISGGLGSALRQAFIARGDKVYGGSRNQSSDQSEDSSNYIVDVSSESDMRKLIERLRGKGVVPDLVINCSGIMEKALLMVTEGQSFENIMKTNVMGPFLINREFSRLMLPKKKSLIIHFSSIHVKAASVGTGVYSASKSAVETLTRVFDNELKGMNVRIRCIVLSYVESLGMTNEIDPENITKALALAKTGRVVPFAEVFQTIIDLNDGNYANDDPIISIGL